MTEVENRSVLAALYPLGLALVVSPMIQLLSRVWPLKPGALNWRFGAVGLGLDSLLPMLLGVGLLLAIAAALGHRAVIRSIAVLCILGFVIAGAVLVVFVLDFLQIRATVTTIAARHTVDIAWGRSMVLAGLSEIIAAGFAIGGWRAAKAGAAAARRAREAHVGVVIPTTQPRQAL